MNFLFIDDDVPHSTSYDVYISQFICFAVEDFNTRNKVLTVQLLKQGLS